MTDRAQVSYLLPPRQRLSQLREESADATPDHPRRPAGTFRPAPRAGVPAFVAEFRRKPVGALGAALLPLAVAFGSGALGTCAIPFVAGAAQQPEHFAPVTEFRAQLRRPDHVPVTFAQHARPRQPVGAAHDAELRRALAPGTAFDDAELRAAEPLAPAAGEQHAGLFDDATLPAADAWHDAGHRHVAALRLTGPRAGRRPAEHLHASDSADHSDLRRHSGHAALRATADRQQPARTAHDDA